MSQNSPVVGWTSLDWEPQLRAPQTAAEPEPPQPPAASQPVFTRSPRKRVPFPRESLTIQPPPGAPNPPATSLLSILLPVLGSGLGVVISVFAAASNGSGAIPIFAFVSLPMILFSVAAGLFNHNRQKKKYESTVTSRETSYRAYLAAQRRQLAQWAEQQQRASQDPNPEPRSCLRLAATRDLRLWERQPEDDDFLRLRLGIGRARPTFQLKAPELPAGVLQPDPLLSAAAAVPAEFATIPQHAVTLPLTETGAVGLVGSRAHLLALTRALLIQLATHHAPNEVKLVLVLPDQEAGQWHWARWLPHLWNSEQTVRYFLTSDVERHTHLNALEEQLKQRLLQAPSGSNNRLAPLPRYVFVFANEKVWSGSERDAFSPLLDLLLNQGRALGAYSIFLTEQRARVPKDCQALVELEAGARSASLYSTLNPADCADFVPDLFDTNEANTFSRALAPIQLETLSGAEQIPPRVSITDLFGVGNIHELSVEQLWHGSDPTRSLAAPFGMRSGGKRAKIDLQDASVGGFGSHALVGGTTGTGKTRFLQTLILLMAAHYRPSDVQFVLIDFKGGDLMRGLEDLPHVISSLTNIENQGNQSDLVLRLFTAFDVEIRRRQALFQKVNASGINSYMRDFAGFGPGAQPLGHLFIVIDEFAELIIKNPDANLMKRLISLGQIGRSVGVHLILATQNPGTIIHEDLRNVLNTRICLRMGSREASSQILRRTDAFDSITKDQVGRAYIQVGNNDVFEPLQVAYGGALNGSGPDPSAQVLRLVRPDGRRKALQAQAESTAGELQMDVLARQITATAARLGYQRQPGIWLPLLPAELYRESLPGCDAGFDGTVWPAGLPLAPAVGLLDDPQNRRQEALRANLSANHHMLVYGGPSTGKTTLLHSLLVSAAHLCSPGDLHIYIMDFGGRNFNLFNTLPHTGAVITNGENERVRRLLSFFQAEFERRTTLFQNSGVKSLEEYRKRAAEPLPDLLLVIDNYTGFHDAFVKNAMQTPELDVLVKIAAEGGSLGFHLVISSPSVLSNKVSDPMKLVAALELNSAQEYSQALHGLHGMTPTKGVRGRGLVRLPAADRAPRVLEFQGALPANGSSEYDRTIAMREQFNTMAGVWGDGPLPMCIPALPMIVRLQEETCVPAAAKAGALPIGIDLSTPDLKPLPVSLDDGPHFWIAGPSYSGKTTLLQTWLAGLAYSLPPERLRFLLIDLADGGLARLASLPHCIGCINDREQLKKNPANPTYNPVEEILSAAPPAERLVIAIDDLALFNKLFDLNLKFADPVIRSFLVDSAESRKLPLEGWQGARVHLIATGMLNDFASSAANPLADPIKRPRSGFLIGTADSGNAVTYLGVKLGSAEAGKPVAAGSGFRFLRGSVRPAMFATCAASEAEFQQWIERCAAAGQAPVPAAKKRTSRKPAGAGG